jgi:hypothetical protein
MESGKELKLLKCKMLLALFVEVPKFVFLVTVQSYSGVKCARHLSNSCCKATFFSHSVCHEM